MATGVARSAAASVIGNGDGRRAQRGGQRDRMA
jgi:hypothetical protein